jgi:hypothetical protein
LLGVRTRNPGDSHCCHRDRARASSCTAHCGILPEPSGFFDLLACFGEE